MPVTVTLVKLTGL